MARVIINGLSGLQKRLSNMSSKMFDEIKHQTLDSATQIEMDAIAAAPDKLLIRGQKSAPAELGITGSIDKVVFKNGFAYEIGVQSKSKIPVYVEFGTGTDAAEYVPTLPKEIQDYARKFYVNGKGRIIKQPYLIPAFLRESPLFIKELEKILKKNA